MPYARSVAVGVRGALCCLRMGCFSLHALRKHERRFYGLDPIRQVWGCRGCWDEIR
jgi:hypothetical protein